MKSRCRQRILEPLIVLEGRGKIQSGLEPLEYSRGQAWFLPAGKGEFRFQPAGRFQNSAGYVPLNPEDFASHLETQIMPRSLLLQIGAPMSAGRAKVQPLPACAVLLAGGRGTRFWPRSRMRSPKQLLNITGQDTMLRETAARLAPLLPAKNLWAVTNAEQAAAVRRELSGVPKAHILAEPIGRNTAAAIGLAAFHLAHQHGDALMAVLPADSYIADAAQYRTLVRAALELAGTPGDSDRDGIPPTRPETGYGYIERGAMASRPRGASAYVVERFTEKPDSVKARKYVASGRYSWNAGMFFWARSTYLETCDTTCPIRTMR